MIYNKNENNINNKNEKKIWNKLLNIDNKGQLLIGFNHDEINDIFNIKMENYEIRRVKAEKEKETLLWSLYFEDIYLYDTRIADKKIIINNDEEINKKHLKNNFAELLITKEYNIGTKEFQALINEEFFSYYFENNISSYI